MADEAKANGSGRTPKHRRLATMEASIWPSRLLDDLKEGRASSQR